MTFADLKKKITEMCSMTTTLPPISFVKETEEQQKAQDRFYNLIMQNLKLSHFNMYFNNEKSKEKTT